MIKCAPPAEVEDKIRKLAKQRGLPVTQFLNLYLPLIADELIELVPQMTQRPVARAA